MPLESGLTSLNYIAISLTPGYTYQFEVKARNDYGFGLYSNIVTILAAQIPDAPTDLANVPAKTTAH
jgi:heterodisulfide reductase subunit A-like polyferredoxin